MKKTFTTKMPDQAGSFMLAGRAAARAGVNITRVSYNKAVDTHTLFFEAEGERAALEQVERELNSLGMLDESAIPGKVLLLEFRLADHPGAVLPVLELISKYQFNISYISSQQNGTPYQLFKMGLLVENHADAAEFMRSVSQLCEVRVVRYDKSEKVLDNTVFYISFAGEIADKLSLSAPETKSLMVQSNLVMQLLDERNKPPYQTFEYIGRFADFLAKYREGDFPARVSVRRLLGGGSLAVIEPPCGSNTYALERNGRLLLVDGGFCRYRAQTLNILRSLFDGFDQLPKDALLTHADVDHVGLLSQCERIFLSSLCRENFALELAGEPGLRGRNPIHAPYCAISKILSGYRPLPLEALRVIGDARPEDGLAPIGKVEWEGLVFEAWQGAGGHVPGETVFLCPSEKLAFTGDIFVNLKDMTPEQAAFGRLAPFLMTSVDTHPQLARQVRLQLLDLLRGEDWLLLGGHGAPCPLP